MTDRKNWPLALSVGPTAMNAASLDALAAAGIHQVELSSGQILPFYELLDFPHRAQEIAELAAAHDVRITSIHLPFSPFTEIDPASTDPAIRTKFLAIQTDLVEAAAAAGIPLAIVHPSGEPYKEEERPARLAWAIETIDALCKRATALGITLCLENLPRTCLCRDSAEMIRLLAGSGADAIFDTNHNLSEDNIHFVDALTAGGIRIASLHISDYGPDEKGVLDERHRMPGDGINRWNDLLAALERHRYQGPLMYEISHQPKNRDAYTIEAAAANMRDLAGGKL